MLTFLELYQTLLGFVFYKLYTDINLVYPPKLDEALDEGGAGIGALLLEESGKSLIVVQDTEVGEGEKEKKRVYAKDVRNKIREIGTGDDQASGEDEEMVSSTIAEVTSQELDVFIAPSSTNAVDHIPQPLSSASTSNLFSSYFFYLSREVTRPTLEFVLRSFSGQVGWDSTLGAGSPFTENDPKITHHVVDRPLAAGVTYDHPGKRSYVQPQWVIDCVNKGRLLPTGDYAPGKTLPPHLSPFVDEDVVRERGGYVPMEAEGGARKQLLDEEEDDEDEDEHEEMDDQEEDDEVEQELVTKKKGKKAPSKALLAAAQDPDNLTLLHAAELEAEAAGIAPDQFEKELKDVTKKVGGGAKKSSGRNKKEEEQLASIVLTGKQKKLYKKMQWSQDRREEDVSFFFPSLPFASNKREFLLTQSNSLDGEIGAQEEAGREGEEEGFVEAGFVVLVLFTRPCFWCHGLDLLHIYEFSNYLFKMREVPEDQPLSAWFFSVVSLLIA